MHDDDYYDEHGFFKDVRTRPRNICVPCKHACGILTSVQKLWWNPLKKVLPCFIQGMDCHAMEERVRSYLKQGWRSVATDGSGWDSTQFTQLAQAGANKFFKAIRKTLVRQMERLIEDFPGLIGYTAETLADKIER